MLNRIRYSVHCNPGNGAVNIDGIFIEHMRRSCDTIIRLLFFFLIVKHIKENSMVIYHLGTPLEFPRSIC